MKPKFAVQMTGINNDELHRIVNALKSIDASYDTFGLIPFTNAITNREAFEDDLVVIPLGGTKLISMHLAYALPDNWRVFYNPMVLDQFYAMNFLGDELLNATNEVHPFDVARSMYFDKPMFVKPTNDLKVFGGMQLEPNQSLDEALAKVVHQEINDNESIMFAPVQSIGREFRLAIVEDHIVDLSQYRENGRVVPRALTMSEADRLLAESIYTYFEGLRSYNLPTPRAYVMDICEVMTGDDDPQWRIVECNCFNAAGLYEADRAAIYSAVIQHIERVYG